MLWALRESENKSEDRTVRNLIGKKFDGEFTLKLFSPHNTPETQKAPTSR